jgi:hypothetical protein
VETTKRQAKAAPRLSAATCCSSRPTRDHPECAALKSELLLKFVHAEMAKAPLPMPRIAGA